MSHIITAAGEKGVTVLFDAARDHLHVSNSNSANLGAFTASYAIEFHLAGGTLDMRSNNTIQLKELDIKWDTLKVCIGFDIPKICVGGFCIIPNPFTGGCAVRAPEFCVFEANPDISFCLDLGHLVTSEVSLTVAPVVKYFNDPAHVGLSDLEAHEQNHPNKWQLFIDPVTLDLDIFDVADSVGDLIENAIDNALDGILGGLPGWAKDLIRAILGPVVGLIRTVLDLGDDVQEWFSDLFGVSLGLFDFILNVIADYFAAKTPLFELPDPYPALPADPSGPLIQVLIPIKEVGVNVTDTELVMQASVGA